MSHVQQSGMQKWMERIVFTNHILQEGTRRRKSWYKSKKPKEETFSSTKEQVAQKAVILCTSDIHQGTEVGHGCLVAHYLRTWEAKHGRVMLSFSPWAHRIKTRSFCWKLPSNIINNFLLIPNLSSKEKENQLNPAPLYACIACHKSGQCRTGPFLPTSGSSMRTAVISTASWEKSFQPTCL